ncbi:hypothetical protein ACLOJK_004492, partial [Asimina triloba]
MAATAASAGHLHLSPLPPPEDPTVASTTPPTFVADDGRLPLAADVAEEAKASPSTTVRNPPCAGRRCPDPNHSSRRRRRAHSRSVEAASRRSSQWPHEANLPRPSSMNSSSSRSDRLDLPFIMQATVHPLPAMICIQHAPAAPTRTLPRSDITATPTSICQHAATATASPVPTTDVAAHALATASARCPLPASTAFIHAVGAAHQRP